MTRYDQGPKCARYLISIELMAKFKDNVFTVVRGKQLDKSTQVIIVTGGSKGLGMGFVENLLNEGHQVHSYSRTKTDFIEKMLKIFSKTFFWSAVDGKQFDQVEEFIKNVYGTAGRIDVLINNAGIAIDGVLTLMKTEDISSLLSLNLESCIRAARIGAKYMLIKNSGVIINISSIIGIRGYSGLSVYSATKAGLDGFTRGLARELGGRGIRVNSVSPGYLETEMSSTLGDTQRQQIIRRTPAGRLGKVEDVTGVVSFLISDKAQFMTGQTIVVDGGITC